LAEQRAAAVRHPRRTSDRLRPSQKIAVIDDALALCGGIDFTGDRWDTREHKHRSRFRRALGRSYVPRHEIAAAVDGAAARAVGELARDRWRTATGQSLASIDAAHVVLSDCRTASPDTRFLKSLRAAHLNR
jgi:phosphatidylserine/phosphatidylglycerophosphate/cardiolipin synthase-like enzyme